MSQTSDSTKNPEQDNAPEENKAPDQETKTPEKKTAEKKTAAKKSSSKKSTPKKDDEGGKKKQAASYKNLDGKQVELTEEQAATRVIVKVTSKQGQDVEPYITGFDKRDAKRILDYDFIAGEVLYKPDGVEL